MSKTFSFKETKDILSLKTYYEPVTGFDQKGRDISHFVVYLFRPNFVEYVGFPATSISKSYDCE